MKCPLRQASTASLEANSTILEEQLVSGKLDFAVIHASSLCEKAHFKYDVLRQDPFIVVASRNSHLAEHAVISPGYPYPLLDLSVLQNEPLLLLHKPQRIRQISDGILKNADILQPNIALTVGNFRTAQLLATEGFGVTFVPTSYSQGIAYDKEPAFFSIDQKYDPYWKMCITTTLDGYLSKADLMFIETMRQLYSNAPK